MLVIETAFSDGEADIAVVSQHLAPRLLAHELRALAPQVPVYITHMKPGEQAQVASELAGLDSHRILPLETGQVFHLCRRGDLGRVTFLVTLAAKKTRLVAKLSPLRMRV